ncbi:MAG: DUF3524 domain-containing protein [Bacteroidota bacterium]
MPKKITLIEPFFTGSHQQWAEGLQKNSRYEIEILSLKGRHWKWRMYGGAVVLAEKFNQLKYRPDLILATDMLDLTTFLALTREKSGDVPVAIYFHENQITYPWSPDDADVESGRNNQYGFVNYTSALAADRVFFNSNFHKEEFLNTLPVFLSQFPDHQGLHHVEGLLNKSKVLHLGMNLKRFDSFKNARPKNNVPVLLWNHRWEYDKNPDLFFNALFQLKKEPIDFRLIVLGESYQKSPPVFARAKKELKEQIIHFGYADSFETYASLIWQTDILPVTSRQDFFGGSVVEGVYCDCEPLLPNRLAYPEHFSKGIIRTHFYESENEFYDALKKRIQLFNCENKFNGRQFVEKYDWEELIGKYDREFDRLISAG